MNNNTKDTELWSVISEVISRLEKDEEIVICSSSQNTVVREVYEAVLKIVPQSNITSLELFGVRSLILEASDNPKFFDSEMSTLTGFTPEQFKNIAGKLPRE